MPSLNSRKVCFSFVIAFVLTGTAIYAQENPKPTKRNISYGTRKRNVLDFWQAESNSPTPLVIFIHGGGFQARSKDNLNPAFLRQLLDAGLSVAAINYRYVQIEPFPAAFYDSRRALQFLRSKSHSWNFDPSQIGAFGGSAGAMISMWLGFHEDMRNPDSPDPVERESTRLAFIATMGGQITFDRHWFEQSIPANTSINKNPAFLKLFGVKSLDDLDEGEPLRWVRELSPITHLSEDDPGIYMEYFMAPEDKIPSDRRKIKEWALHHVIFGLTLKVRMEALGLEAALKYPGKETSYGSIPGYFKSKFGKM